MNTLVIWGMSLTLVFGSMGYWLYFPFNMMTILYTYVRTLEKWCIYIHDATSSVYPTSCCLNLCIVFILAQLYAVCVTIWSQSSCCRALADHVTSWGHRTGADPGFSRGWSNISATGKNGTGCGERWCGGDPPVHGYYPDDPISGFWSKSSANIIRWRSRPVVILHGLGDLV